MIKILQKKHLLIIGGSAKERHNLISEIITKVNFETFRFPKKMKLLDEYIQHIRKEKLYNSWYTQKGNFGTNQMLDFHWDWVSDSNSLVIIEEYQQMEERWKLELIRIYLQIIDDRKKGQKTIHLIITQQNEDDLMNKLSENVYIRENERRNKRQVVEGSLKVINLKEIGIA